MLVDQASLFKQLFGSSLVSVSLNLILWLLVALLIGQLISNWLNFKQNRALSLSYLELLIPQTSFDKQPVSQDLFEALYTLLQGNRKRSFGNRSLKMSLEIAADQAGTRFIMGVPVALVSQILKYLAINWPEVMVNETEDYVSDTSGLNVESFRLLRNAHKKVGDKLPLVIATLEELKADKLAALQIVITPNSAAWLTKVSRGRLSFSSISQIVLRSLERALMVVQHMLLGSYYHGSSSRTAHKSAQNNIGPAEASFNLDFRLIYPASQSHDPRLEVIKALLRVKGLLINSTAQDFKLRKASIFRLSTNTASPADLADVYHLPDFLKLKSLNLDFSHGLKLPLPKQQKRAANLDILLGENDYQGQITSIGLSSEERARHVLVLGSTGSGKTTLLKYCLVQDIKAGKGLALIDPHGDLAEELLKHIPPKRLKDVVYFDPADISHPIGLNLLELTPKLGGDDRLRELDYITESVVSIFRKLFSGGEAGGQRLEHILRNAVQTALLQPDCTLFTVYRLLVDLKYRNEIVSALSDKTLKNFWKNEYGQAGSMQRVKLSIGITSKLGRLLRSSATRRILGQVHSTLDFDELVTQDKILICNFSKGRLGEDTALVMGLIVIAKLQLAAYKRADILPSQRHPFYLYIDECQNFVTAGLLNFLSESRKYGMHLILAEQSPSQQADLSEVSSILANVGTTICFRCSSPLDEKLLLPLFKPSLNQGGLLNLDAFRFYARIAATDWQGVMSGKTVLVKPHKSANSKLIRETSQARYSFKAVASSEAIKLEL